MNNQKTNWKYVLTVIIIGFIVGGGILVYGYIIQKKIDLTNIKTSVLNYSRPEAKEIIPVIVEKKISNELASIFREKINEDLLQNSEPEIQNDILILQKSSIDCDRSLGVDLNDDGIEEFVIFPYWFCGEMAFRGVSGNGPIYMFQKTGGEWKNVGRLDGNGIEIERKKTKGYLNLFTFWHLGTDSSQVNYYIWDGAGYAKEKSEEIEVGI